MSLSRRGDAARILERLPKQQILVIGDVIVDRFIRGTASRISPEAPVVVVEERSETYVPGGAGNVANNARALGAKVSLAGVIGDDPVGRLFIEDLGRLGIGTEGLFVDQGRRTSLKTRIIAEHQQVVRIDRETKAQIGGKTEERILDFVRRAMASCDAVVLSDYAKGMLTEPIIRRIIKLSRLTRTLVVAGPKPQNIDFYKDTTIISLNQSEARACLSLNNYSHDTDIERLGPKLLRRLGSKALLITRGEHGMALFERGRTLTIPAQAKEVFDVTGAGDTVIAVLTVCLAAGATPETAARIANAAAGIVVGKLGTATVSLEELRKAL